MHTKLDTTSLKTQNTLASDIMSAKLVVIHPHQTYRKAIELLTQNRLIGLPVVNEEGSFLGMITEKEILKASNGFSEVSGKFLDSSIRYRKKVKKATPDTPIHKIVELLSGKSYRHLPIVDESGILRGIVTRRDLIRILYVRIELNFQTENPS